MVVSPNSDIILYSGMPLDDTYTDTLYFDSRSAQTSFFTGGNAYEKRRFTSNTYQRVNEGVFDCQCLADEIYDCNYMAFRNTNFGSKWFYAFINSVEYVNNGMARVAFSIDSIQTYLFDCTLEECMVEREHSTVDSLGSNLEPEPFSITEYEYDHYGELNGYATDLYDCDVIVMVVEIPEEDSEETPTVDGSIYGNIYSGATLYAFGSLINQPVDTVVGLNSFLEQYIKKPDSIVNMYIAPHFISGGVPGGKEIQGYWSGGGHRVSIDWDPPNFEFFDIPGFPYSPANKKLFTYPFSYCHVDNSNGGSLALRFELFNTRRPTFTVYASPISPVQMTLCPRQYKNTPTGGNPLFAERLVMDEYPLCSWNYDTYKAWMAQNGVPMLIGTAKNAAQGAMAGGPIGFAMGAVSSAIDVGTNAYQASIQADTLRGNSFSGNANFANNFARFNIGRARPTLQQIQVIDNFFTMYGYATNRVKVPNRNARPHFTYVKTRGAKVIGKCPSDELKKICSIYDNGITWWVSADEVGNYSLDNSPE